MTAIALDELSKRTGAVNDATPNEDLLGQLLEAHSKNPDKFSVDDVFSIAHGAVFAGSDSTASTMQSFFYHVLSDRKVWQKLTDEIHSATLSPMVSWTEAQSLSFFQACLKEAMRVRPAVGVNMVRHVPRDGAEIDGTFFSGGTRVALNGWVLHRDKTVFGEDAEVFRPERWLEAGEKQGKVMERGIYQVREVHFFEPFLVEKHYPRS